MFIFQTCWCSSRPDRQHLHVYPLGYLWNCHRERAYAAAGLNGSGIPVFGGPTETFLFFHPYLGRHAASRKCVDHHLLWQLSLYSCIPSILGPLIACFIFGGNRVGHVFLLHTVSLWLELLSQEILDTLMFWARWFNPVNFYRLISRRRRSTETKKASDTHGQVFDVESVVSGGSVLDIRKETMSTHQGLAL
jgi:hypothetical protein